MAIFGTEFKTAKFVPKSTLETHQTCSMQKTARRNAYYSRNDKIFKSGKNGHIALAIVRQNELFWDGI